MTKCWLVTAGEYSDYGVVGVFSTKKKAEAFRKAHIEPPATWADASVRLDERELDPPCPQMPPGMSAWWVSMHDDGSVPIEPQATSWPFSVEEYGFSYYVLARDAQGAIKIANERRIANKLKADLERGHA